MDVVVSLKISDDNDKKRNPTNDAVETAATESITVIGRIDGAVVPHVVVE